MESNLEKIYIGIPSRELHSTHINGKLVQLLMDWQTDSRYQVTVKILAAQPVERARNNLVQQFLASDCDYLLMIDDDITPPENILQLAVHGKDVVAGLCYACNSSLGIFPVAYQKAENGVFRGGYKLIGTDIDAENQGLLQVELVGSGCIMIHRRVFARMDQPYFKFTFNEDLTQIEESEDFDFCNRVIAAGMQVYVDTDRVCGHLKAVDLREVLRSTTYQCQQRRQQKLDQKLKTLFKKTE